MAGAKTAGAKRALPLAVSIAAHSPLMSSIQIEWSDAVNEANFLLPQIPVIGNVYPATLGDEAAARADIISQMQSRVRWTESVKLMAAQGVTNFVEVGTGTVLGGLIKRIADGVTTYPLGSPTDFVALE
jgi:[acyl-carrier-protein] S-malonyltransferase